MNNPLIQTLLKQLEIKNPKGFQSIQGVMSSGGNPEALVKQVLGNMSPEQKENILKQAKQYGVPNEVLSKIQNIK